MDFFLIQPWLLQNDQMYAKEMKKKDSCEGDA